MSLRIETSVIQGNDYITEVIRTSRRRAASIKVIEGKVSIIVPDAFSIEKIQSFLIKKHRWIKEKLALQEQLIANQPKEFVSGEAFSYLGRNYRLKVVDGAYPSIKVTRNK